MKKQLLLPFSILCFTALFLLSFSGMDSKYPSGAPAGYSGSPADNANCTQCHGGSPTTVSGWITSDVPASGYTPGTTYTITASSVGSGRKGFEISPQSLSGTMLGSLSAGSGNQVVGTKYVTHTVPLNGTSATWTFSWTAPSAGTGPVTFYGAFAVSQASTNLSTLIIQEKTTSSIENPLNDVVFRVFPNPVMDMVSASFYIQNEENITLSIYDVTGKKILTIFNEILPAGSTQKSFDLRNLLPSGIYFVTLSNGSTINISKKIVLCF